MFLPLQGQSRMHAEATVLSVPGFDLAPEHRNALAHAHQALAGHGAILGCSPDATPIVAYVDLHVIVAVAEPHRRTGGTGVLEGVAQCLLDDPERRQVDARLEPLALALDLDVDLEARLARPLHERVELVHARLRGEQKLVLALPEHANHPAHLLESRAPGLLHGS